MKKFLIVALAAIALSGCGVNEVKGKRALESQGYTNVKIEGFSFFGCGEKDTFRSAFSATGTNGAKVTGVLCSGMFKGITVRMD